MVNDVVDDVDECKVRYIHLKSTNHVLMQYHHLQQKYEQEGDLWGKYGKHLVKLIRKRDWVEWFSKTYRGKP